MGPNPVIADTELWHDFIFLLCTLPYIYLHYNLIHSLQQLKDTNIYKKNKAFYT